MTTIKLNGIKLSAEVYEALEWAGCASDECVAADLNKLRSGGRSALIARCIDGAEDPETIAAWREYVETLEAAL
jgi:hypothetical protein